VSCGGSSVGQVCRDLDGVPRCAGSDATRRPSPDRSCAVPSQRETARQQASKDGVMEGLAVRDDSEWHESKDRAGSTDSRVPGSIF